MSSVHDRNLDQDKPLLPEQTNMLSYECHALSQTLSPQINGVEESISRDEIRLEPQHVFVGDTVPPIFGRVERSAA